MVDKVCVKMWATKLLSEFSQFLVVAKMGVTQRVNDLEHNLNSMACLIM